MPQQNTGGFWQIFAIVKPLVCSIVGNHLAQTPRHAKTPFENAIKAPKSRIYCMIDADTVLPATSSSVLSDQSATRLQSCLLVP